MLKIIGVSKSINGFEIIRNVSITVPNGEIFALVGPNGAGKTTIIKLITGLLLPNDGDVEIDGNSIVTQPLRVKQSIGYVFDDIGMLPDLTGLEYLRFMANAYSVEVHLAKERINKYTEIFNLKGDIHRMISAYSLGMKQKLIIMGAVLHQPSLLIMDEPFRGLDPQGMYELKRFVTSYVNDKNHSVFISSHMLDIVEKISTSLGIINKGKMIFLGSQDELKNGKDLEEAYIDLFNDESKKRFRWS